MMLFNGFRDDLTPPWSSTALGVKFAMMLDI